MVKSRVSIIARTPFSGSVAVALICGTLAVALYAHTAPHVELDLRLANQATSASAAPKLVVRADSGASSNLALTATLPRARAFVWLLREGGAMALAPNTPVELPASARAATFILDPTAIGRPPPTAATYDVFRIDVGGRLPRGRGGGHLINFRSSPRVSASPATGQYAFALALPPVPGTRLTVAVRVHQTGFVVAALGSRTCANKKAAPVQAIDITVVAPKAGPDDAAPTPLLLPCGRGGADEMVTGWYESSQHGAAPRPVDIRQHARQSFSWTPAQCRLDAFTAASARTCLAGRWLAFVGDSTMEEIAIATVLLLHGSFDHAWTRARCKGNPSSRMFDTGTDLPDGIRVTMWWAGTRETCRNFEGTVVFADPLFVSRFTAFHARDGVNGTRSPTVIANSGLHDLARETPLTREEYAGMLSTLMLPLLLDIGAPHHIVWKAINPKLNAMVCHRGPWLNRSEFEASGDAAVQVLNAAAEGAIAALPAAARRRFALLDEHALLLPMYEEMDNHHCTVVRTENAGRRSMDGVFSGCLATVHALLALLCADGGAA